MSSELRATLAISKSEAVVGTSRTLTHGPSSLDGKYADRIPYMLYCCGNHEVIHQQKQSMRLGFWAPHRKI